MKKVFLIIILLTALSISVNLYVVYGQEITVRGEMDFTTMDPAQISRPTDHTIAANIYNGLVKFNPKTFKAEPDLAKSWEVSPDMLTYTFHLRNDVYWHKGYGKFTAKDVKYTFDRVMDKNTQSRFRVDFKDIKEVAVVDDYTVKIIFKVPDMSFMRKVLIYRPGYIVNQKAIETLGKQYNSSPIGTGPYIFEQWVPGSKAVLVANDKYFLGPPKLKKATFLIITEDSVAQMALQKGEVDIAYFRSMEQLDRLKKDTSITIEGGLSLAINYLIINNCRKPFDDVRVRRAIHHAIDKNALVNAVYAGFSKPTSTILIPSFPGHNPNVRIYEYNPEKARKFLAEAGYSGGLKTSLLYYPATPWKDYAPIIQDQLHKIGIELQLKAFDTATVESIRRKGDYDLLYGTFSRPPDPDIVFSSYFHSESVPFPNMSCFKNKEVDRLTMQGNRERDEEKRWKIYRTIQEIIAEDTPVIPIDNRWEMVALKRYIKGYTYTPLIYYDLDNVNIEGKK